MKIKSKAILLILFVFWATSALSQSVNEDRDQLAERIQLSKIEAGLSNGDRSVLSILPAKGYKNGLSGLMKKYNFYPSPDYSFTKLTSDSIIISIKLATKASDGQYEDRGYRIEYAIYPGTNKFIAHDSTYARHVIAGDGVLEHELSHSGCVSLGNAMKCGIH